jgi:N-acetylglucosamine-6-phosphate deacetylase
MAGSVEMNEGRIRRVKKGDGSAKAKGRRAESGAVVDLRGGYLAPGFIDLHVHGALGRDTMEATEDAFRVISQYHLSGGTTSFTPTTISAPTSAILAVLQAAQPWLDKSLGGARLVGIHLEGPFLSPHKAGAHDPGQLRPPQAHEWRQFLRFQGLVSQMTLAPELPGAGALMRALKKHGAIISGGHTNGTEPQLKLGLQAGLRQTTHTFNCMSTAVKEGPYRVAGMLELALAEPGICCELIADGCHVAPTLMRMLYRAKGPDGICLITDAIPGAGLPVGTVFRPGGPSGLAAKVTTEAALLVDGSALAGSTLTMIEAIRRAVQLAQIPLAEAVRMASLTPARQLNRAAELGSIETGKRADLVWFDTQFRVRAVWLDGDLRFWA